MQQKKCAAHILSLNTAILLFSRSHLHSGAPPTVLCSGASGFAHGVPPARVPDTVEAQSNDARRKRYLAEDHTPLTEKGSQTLSNLRMHKQSMSHPSLSGEQRCDSGASQILLWSVCVRTRFVMIPSGGAEHMQKRNSFNLGSLWACASCVKSKIGILDHLCAPAGTLGSLRAS